MAEFTGPTKPSDEPASATGGGGAPADAGTADRPPQPEGRKRTGGAGGAKKAAASGKRASAPRASAQPNIRDLEKRLEELFGAAALPFMFAGDAHCAQIVANGAQPLAHAWTNLAKESPAVRKVLHNLTQSSAWGEVIIATGSVVIPIMAHHTNFVPDMSGFFGGGEEENDDTSPAPPSPPPPTDSTARGNGTPPTREQVATQPTVPSGAAVSIPTPPQPPAA